MSRDKQMINDLIEIFDEEYGKRNLITPQNTAEKMTAKGYRKSTDVAEEIFAEIEELFHILVGNETGKEFYSIVASEYAELKKKYTEVAERREVSENNTVRCFHPSVTESQREAERRKGVENSPVDCSTPSVTDQKGEGK